MSYTPTEWKNGDKATSSLLNKIEGALGALIATSELMPGSASVYALNITPNDVINAINNGKEVIVMLNDEDYQSIYTMGFFVNADGNYAILFDQIFYYSLDADSVFMSEIVQ